MRVAVTGISGYLGGLLADALERDSSVHSILGLDLVPPKGSCSKLEYQPADLRYSDFEQLLRGADALFHLAFVVAPPDNRLLGQIEQINVEGSRRLFQGAIDAGVPKIIFISSVAAYGAHPDNPALLTEETPLRPNPGWYYSRTKGQVESILDDLERQALDSTIIRLRPCTIVGPGSNTRLGSFLGLPVLPCLQKQLKLDLCWEVDAIDAFMLALHCEHSGAYNLSGGNPLTIEDMARMLGKRAIPCKTGWILPALRLLSATGMFPRAQLELFETGLRYSINVSTEKAKRVLGWHPSRDSTATLLEYAGFWR